MDTDEEAFLSLVEQAWSDADTDFSQDERSRPPPRLSLGAAQHSTSGTSKRSRRRTYSSAGSSPSTRSVSGASSTIGRKRLAVAMRAAYLKENIAVSAKMLVRFRTSIQGLCLSERFLGRHGIPHSDIWEESLSLNVLLLRATHYTLYRYSGLLRTQLLLSAPPINIIATCQTPQQATKRDALVLRQEACELVQYTNAKLQRAQGYLQLLATQATTLRELPAARYARV